MALKHECPECGRMTRVGPRGTWYSHQRADAPNDLCPLSARPAGDRASDPKYVLVRADDRIEPSEAAKRDLRRRAAPKAVLRGDEESTSVRTVSGGLPGTSRRSRGRRY